FRSSEQSCKRQLQQVNLRHCENHIDQRIQQQQEEEED
nr:conglutin delta S [Lupinus angustifolius]